MQCSYQNVSDACNQSNIRNDEHANTNRNVIENESIIWSDLISTIISDLIHSYYSYRQKQNGCGVDAVERYECHDLKEAVERLTELANKIGNERFVVSRKEDTGGTQPSTTIELVAVKVDDYPNITPENNPELCSIITSTNSPSGTPKKSGLKNKIFHRTASTNSKITPASKASVKSCNKSNASCQQNPSSVISCCDTKYNTNKSNASCTTQPTPCDISKKTTDKETGSKIPVLHGRYKRSVVSVNVKNCTTATEDSISSASVLGSIEIFTQTTIDDEPHDNSTGSPTDNRVVHQSYVRMDLCKKCGNSYCYVNNNKPEESESAGICMNCRLNELKVNHGLGTTTNYINHSYSNIPRDELFGTSKNGSEYSMASTIHDNSPNWNYPQQYAGMQASYYSDGYNDRNMNRMEHENPTTVESIKVEYYPDYQKATKVVKTTRPPFATSPNRGYHPERSNR